MKVTQLLLVTPVWPGQQATTRGFTDCCFLWSVATVITAVVLTQVVAGCRQPSRGQRGPYQTWTASSATVLLPSQLQTAGPTP